MKRVFSSLLFTLALICGATAQPASEEPTWQKGPDWVRNAVFYQLYPSSYQDSDGNGIGDLPGIISRLDYIKSLGVDAVWFNPIFHSGWVDGGYDIIDFYKVDPRFGTNADLERLCEECHKRGLKVLMDLVAGHSSNQCQWFKESMQSADSKYADYYIWSNELSESAHKDLQKMLAEKNYMQSTKGKWMVSEAPRAKYYMKNFYACQPALNYGFANPDPNHPWEQSVDAPGPRAVRQELKNILAFWYDKGVDGFRVDMAQSLVKNDKGHKETIRLWREMREWMDSNYKDHVLISEWSHPQRSLYGGFNIDMDLLSTKRKSRLMYFDRKHQAEGGAYFSLDGCQPSLRDLYGNPWPEQKIDRSVTPQKALKSYYGHMSKALKDTNKWGYFASITGNHDHLRMNTGLRNDPKQLKVMISWILTMPTPILYYGDEIGLRSLVGMPSVEGADHDGKERAGARTPMQWDDTKNAGFSQCEAEKLYLPICPDWTPAHTYKQYLEWKKAGKKNPTAKGSITVQSQENDPNSLLSWTKGLIAMRKAHKAFSGDGAWTPLFSEEHPYPMVYERSLDGEKYLVILNPTAKTKSVTLSKQTALEKGSPEVIKSTGKTSYKITPSADQITMGPTSVLIVKTR